MAHPGHDHKNMGTVTMAAADHVMVKDNDGKDAMAIATVIELGPDPTTK